MLAFIYNIEELPPVYASIVATVEDSASTGILAAIERRRRVKNCL